MSDCLFCRISNQSISSSVAYEDEAVMAVMDLRPVAPGHVLVLPRTHYEAITDLPRELFARISTVAHRFAAHLREAFPDAEGVNLLMSEGAVANQSVFHSHMHVIPRRAGDSMVLTSDDPVAPRDALDVSADRWRTALSDGTSS